MTVERNPYVNHHSRERGVNHHSRERGVDHHSRERGVDHHSRERGVDHHSRERGVDHHSRERGVDHHSRERGVTMVSVMLLTVSLLTMGLLAMRSAGREVTQAGQLVARERAVMVAQAAVELAAAQYLSQAAGEIDDALEGFNPQSGTCADPCGDCLPQASTVVTGQRNELLASAASCAGRPCMRQGAVAVLPASDGSTQTWCDIPFRDLVPNADAEARVSVWVRNNSGDALGAAGSGDWADDSDGRVVVTAMATVRNTTVAVEQEIFLSFGDNVAVSAPMSPDEGYGGGHNNDNSAVSVCADDYESADAVP